VELVAIASIEAKCSAVALGADSVAALMLGREASPCPGLLRKRSTSDLRARRDRRAKFFS
jgi:hypothetical protein